MKGLDIHNRDRRSLDMINASVYEPESQPHKIIDALLQSLLLTNNFCEETHLHSN
ncbi:MAG: hypothetical protein UT52_C0032G0005 [Candidatus Uhrbacteria bacterium GW2011_GWE1_39_46]|nr:MAG: hypothetical protein UT52_C0032G0005 [Candidatus Uhrbacteria bacterium GW2011_GWE1_39_46]